MSLSASADEKSELARLKGFAEHQNEDRQFDKLRRRGETEYLETAEQWERQKDKDLADYRKQKAKNANIQSDDGTAAKEDAKTKLAWHQEYEKNRIEYDKQQKSFDRSKHKDLVTEPEEFDLLAQRPRYDYKKRALYGAPMKYGKAGQSSPSSGGGYSPPAPAPFGSNPNFPPPPAYDDFGDGYIPPPTLGDGFGDDLPPPPPPPPPPMDEFNQDFPPPPPPPFMDGDMGGF